MKNKFLAALSASILLSPALLSAQTVASYGEPHSAVQVTFFPPLGTNGLRAARYTNDFSLNLLAGVSKNERAFALTGLTNVVLGNASGFQLSGLVNYTGGETLAFQLGGLANVGLGDALGVQLAGLANVARNLTGLQFGGLANVARDVAGLQFGGLFNVARDVAGLQFGGLFNFARDVEGVQFAGIFNIANSSDYPIGIVNIIRNGEMSVGLGYNEIGTTSLTFRSGGRVLYGILGVGWNHKVDGDDEAFSLMGGYGAHINILPWLRINNEITFEGVDNFNNEESNTFKTGYALLPAFRLGHFELFGGPSINYMQTKDADKIDLFPRNSIWEREYPSRGRRSYKLQQAFIGWQVGVHYIF